MSNSIDNENSIKNSNLSEKANMLNALTTLMVSNHETLGEYFTIRDKALTKIIKIVDSL